MSDKHPIDVDQTVDHRPTPRPATTVAPTQAANSNTPPPHAAPPDAPEISGYAIRGEIAKGGMGRVYAATDLTLGREVAIKTLLPGANSERFVTEAKVTAMLPHPGIPPVHALGTLLDGTPYLVMKLIGGRTLSELLKERPDRQADQPRFVHILEQIALAVGFAHSQGIIHRDLKPLNVMVGAFGEVQVMDWGLAKVQADAAPAKTSRDLDDDDAELTFAGDVLGTPGYMSPEQARGEPVDARADVFALGAILATILTGAPAFLGTTAREIVAKAARNETQDLQERLRTCGADAELISIAERCLAIAPADRPADAAKVATAIAAHRFNVDERLRRAETERAEALVRETELRNRRRLQQWAGGIIAAVLVLGIIGTSIGAYRANVAREREATEKLRANRSAEQATKSAALAKRNEDLAKRNEETAKAHAADANLQRASAERSAYLATVRLANSELQSGHVSRARDYLRQAGPPQLRDWEWNHLHRALYPSYDKYNAPVVWAFSTRVSPDGAWLGTGGVLGAFLWKVGSPDKEPAHVLLEQGGGNANLQTFRFSRDSKLAIGLGKATLLGKTVWQLYTWDVESGSLIAQVQLFVGENADCDVADDGAHCATTGDGQPIAIWSLPECIKLKEIGDAGSKFRKLAFRPKSQELAAATAQGNIEVWNWETDEQVRLLSQEGTCEDLIYSPDGKKLAAAIRKQVRLWDAASGEFALGLEHSQAVQSVAFHPALPYVAAIGTEPGQSALIMQWFVSSGKLLGRHQTDVSKGESLAFGPADHKLYFAGMGNGAFAVNAYRGNGHVAVPTFEFHAKGIFLGADDRMLFRAQAREVSAVGARPFPVPLASDELSDLAVSRDGKLFAVVMKNQFQIRSTQDGQLLHQHESPDETLYCAAFHPTQPILALGSLSGSGNILQQASAIKLRNWETGEALLALKHSGMPMAAAFSPDGSLVAAGVTGTADRNLVRVWRTADGAVVKEVNDFSLQASGVAFSNDGKRMAACGVTSMGLAGLGAALVFDTQTWSTLHTLRAHQNVADVAFSPDSKRLAVAGGVGGNVGIWDLESGQEILTLPFGQGIPAQVNFSPNGRKLAVSGVGSFTVFETSTAADVALRNAKEVTHADLLVDETGTKLIADDGSTVRIMETAVFHQSPVPQTEMPKNRELNGHRDNVTCLALGPGPGQITSASLDGTVKVWNEAETSAVQTLAHPTPVLGVAASSATGMIATAGLDGKVRLWRDGGLDGDPLVADGSAALAVAISPDGSLVAAGGADGIVRVWTIVDRKQLKEFNPAPDVVRTITFTPDGKYVAWGGDGATLWFMSLTSATDSLSLKGTSAIRKLRFNHNGSLLGIATLGAPAMVLSGYQNMAQPQIQIRQYGQDLAALDFTPDGKALYGINSGGHAAKWELAP